MVSLAFFPVEFLRSVRKHLGRALSWELGTLPVTDRERSKIVTQGMTEEPLHRYAVWRRSVLLVVLVPTLIEALLSTLTALSQRHEGLNALGQGLMLVNTIVVWAMPISVLFALRTWTSLRRSHRWLIIGFIIAFLPPFITALVPMSWMYTAQATLERQTSQQRELAALDILNALHVTFRLLPTVLAILPGLVRACLRVKTLLPAAILPGWFLMVAPPFYLLLVLVALITLNHLAPSPMLIVGVLCFMGSSMVYVWRADLFVRPLSYDEGAAIRKAHRMASLVSMFGAILLLVYALTEEVMGLRLAGFEAQSSLLWLWEHREQLNLKPGQAMEQARSLYWLGDISFSHLIAQYLGRSLFMTAVFADGLVRMSLSIWSQERRFAGSPAAGAYDQTMANLERSLHGS